MPDQSKDPCNHGFGEFTLDVRRGTLYRSGAELHLRPKSFEVLRYLVERPGQLVTKGELMDAVWGRTVVTEGSLTQCIIDIRRALGAADAHLVRTVPRRGFVFVPPAPLPTPAASSPSLGGTDPQAVTVSPASRRPAGGWWLRALGVAAVLLGIAIAGWLLTERTDEKVAAGAASGPDASLARSIAVLRFLDLSPDGNQGYFADGLAEEILHLLAQSPELRVTARSSSFAFQPDSADIDTVAEQLQVAYVLEGSVRRAGDALRITVQLIDTASRSHVWSRTYDGSLADVLALQQGIASDVAAALRVTLAPAPARSSPASAEAQDLFLLGRYLFHRRAPGDLQEAERHLERAVAIDPTHARAWTALAGLYAARGNDEAGDPGHRLEEQRQVLERAIAIDPQLAEAHVRLGRYYRAVGDETEARAALERAARLAPDEPLVLATAAVRAASEGRLDDCIALNRRMVAIDPLSALYRNNLAWALLGSGRYDDALLEMRRAQVLAPGAGRDLALGRALLLLGRADEARQAILAAPAGPERDQLRVLVEGPEVASAELARLLSGTSPREQFLLAEIAAFAGDREAAFKRLADATHRTQGAQAEDLWLSPFLRPLHDDPRWPDLLGKLAE